MEIQPEHTETFAQGALGSFASAVFRLALAGTSRQNDAEQITNRVFQLLANRKEPFGSSDEEKSWLLRLTLKQCRAKNTLSFLQEKQESADCLKEFPGTTKTDRILLHLYYCEDYNALELAGLLHRKESWVLKHLRLTTSRLEQSLWEKTEPREYVVSCFDSYGPGSALKDAVKEKMLLKPTVFSERVAVCFGIAVLAVGIILMVQQKPAPIQPAQGEAATPVSFRLYDESRKKEIELKEIHMEDSQPEALEDDRGNEIGQNGNKADDNAQFDFNLRCTGRPDIKWVTYTAHHCEFMKKLYFSKEMEENETAFQYVDGIMRGETADDGTYQCWGYTPIGYKYSADFLEEVNLENFGVKISWLEEDPNQFLPFSTEWSKLKNQCRQDAYQKAWVDVTVELNDGTTISKRIRFGIKPDFNDANIWAEAS